MNKILIFAGLAVLFFNFVGMASAQEDRLVVLETNQGDIVIEFFSDDAPNHVQNFIELTESGYYDGTVFHRIIKDFMIQGGDPQTKEGNDTAGWGTGGPDSLLKAEFNDIKHNRGIVSMARTANPDSAGSQFFIVHGDSNYLDLQYTVFGRIVTQESFDALDKIASLEKNARDVPNDPDAARIIKAQLVERSEISDLMELGEPERVTSSMVPEQPATGRYTNDELGISFEAPEGWSISQPPKTHPRVPDVVAVADQKLGEVTPAITLSIVYSSGNSLDERIAEFHEYIKPGVEQGLFQIVSEEQTTIHGYPSYVVTAIETIAESSVNVKYKQVIMDGPEKTYTLTYGTDEEFYDVNLADFETTLDSFTIENVKEIPKQTPALSEEISNIEEGGGCLIATATFGTELAPQVQSLRELRDNTLLNTASGTSFMSDFNQLYYSFSPTIADWERESPEFREVVKLTVTPMLATLSILNHVDINSEAEMLGYGISIILLNIGMYAGIPAVVIYRLRK